MSNLNESKASDTVRRIMNKYRMRNKKRIIVPVVMILLAGFSILVNVQADDIMTGTVDVSDHVIQAGGFPESKEMPESGEILRYTSSEASDIDMYNEIAGKLAMTAEEWDGSGGHISVDVSSYKIPVSKVSRLISTVLNLCPECFMVENDMCDYGYNSSGYVTELKYRVDPSYNREDVDRFNVTADRIISAVDPSWTELQKIIYVHDYLVTHIDYDTSLTRYNAYNAIVEGNAVCQGYALAYEYLLNRIDNDLDCRIVTSDAMKHAWNIVTLDGSRYYIDATWDDPLDMYKLYNSYNNFMVSQSRLHNNHTDTDWLNVYGEKLYDNVPTSDTYDSLPWVEMHSAMPMFGNTGFYYKSGSSMVLYAYDFAGGRSTEISSYDGVWKIWNGSGSWQGCYGSVVRYGNGLIITRPREIMLLEQNGDVIKTYDIETETGDIYGGYIEGDKLTYDVYTAPQPSKGNYIGRYSIELDGIIAKVMGDVTGDGVVAMGDVVKVARAVAGNIILTEDEKKAADVTGDNVIAMGDVVKIARYVAGSVKEL